MASKFFVRGQEVFAQCVFCKAEVKVNLTPHDLAAIMSKLPNAHIQNIPEARKLTADERELFISGVCKTCFDEMFQDGDEDEYDGPPEE